MGLASCRAQPPETSAEQPAAASQASATDAESDPALDRLASFCRIVKVMEGEVDRMDRPVFTLTNAPEYSDDLSASSTVVVRDTPDLDYEWVGTLAGIDGELEKSEAANPAESELILCIYETNNPEDFETCWYLNEEGWYGSLTTYGTKARLYLMEAKTLDLVAKTEMLRDGRGCPETYTLSGDSREEVRNGSPVEAQQIRQWLNRLS